MRSPLTAHIQTQTHWLYRAALWRLPKHCWCFGSCKWMMSTTTTTMFLTATMGKKLQFREVALYVFEIFLNGSRSKSNVNFKKTSILALDVILQPLIHHADILFLIFSILERYDAKVSTTTPFLFAHSQHQKTNLLFGLIGNLAPGVIVERLHTLPVHFTD